MLTTCSCGSIFQPFYSELIDLMKTFVVKFSGGSSEGSASEEEDRPIDLRSEFYLVLLCSRCLLSSMTIVTTCALVQVKSQCSSPIAHFFLNVGSHLRLIIHASKVIFSGIRLKSTL